MEDVPSSDYQRDFYQEQVRELTMTITELRNKLRKTETEVSTCSDRYTACSTRPDLTYFSFKTRRPKLVYLSFPSRKQILRVKTRWIRWSNSRRRSPRRPRPPPLGRCPLLPSPSSPLASPPPLSRLLLPPLLSSLASSLSSPPLPSLSPPPLFPPPRRAPTRISLRRRSRGKRR